MTALAGGAALGWIVWYLIRLRRTINKCDWLVCPKCDHDLRGLAGNPVTCPECGRVWTYRQIELSWELVVGRRKRSGSDEEP